MWIFLDKHTSDSTVRFITAKLNLNIFLYISLAYTLDLLVANPLFCELEPNWRIASFSIFTRYQRIFVLSFFVFLHFYASKNKEWEIRQENIIRTMLSELKSWRCLCGWGWNEPQTTSASLKLEFRPHSMTKVFPLILTLQKLVRRWVWVKNRFTLSTRSFRLGLSSPPP